LSRVGEKSAVRQTIATRPAGTPSTSISRRWAEFSRAIAIDERAARATLDIVPPLDRVDTAEDRLPVDERTIAAGTPKWWWCGHRRRGDRRPPSGPFRRRVGPTSVRCRGFRGIGRALLLGLGTGMACSHVGLRGCQRRLHSSPDAVFRSARNRGSRERRGHALAAGDRETGGSVRKSANSVCRVSNRRKGRRQHSLCYCVHTLSSLPSASPVEWGTAWCATASIRTVM
jgi:hypothetical protein